MAAGEWMADDFLRPSRAHIKGLSPKVRDDMQAILDMGIACPSSDNR
jgi:hypothetical protein